MKSEFDVTIAITFHIEGVFAAASLNSLRDLVAKSRASGINIETLAILDKSDRLTRHLVVNCKNSPVNRIIEVDWGDVGLSRNHAVQLARGEYICFLDGDDVWGEDWVRLAFQAASRPGGSTVIWHPQICYLPPAFGSFSHEQEQIIRYHYPCENRASDKYFALSDNPYTANALASKEIHLRFPYRITNLEKGFAFEDWSWNIETIWAGIAHRVVLDTVHIIRRKTVNSVNKNSLKASALPHFPDPSTYAGQR